jgi:hypothetical protein
MLYASRSVTRAIPMVKSMEDENRVELNTVTFEALKPVVKRLSDLMEFQVVLLQIQGPSRSVMAAVIAHCSRRPKSIAEAGGITSQPPKTSLPYPPHPQENAIKVFCSNVAQLAAAKGTKLVPEGLYTALITMIDVLQKVHSP